jgi:hypothetical protein
MVMFANMWQVLLSVAYLIFNTMVTCLCCEAEWQRFATKTRQLRVTEPTGEQQSSYFISLPWRYGIPFQLAFFVMHWTLSQGLFVVIVETYNVNGLADSGGTPFVESSPPGLILSRFPVKLLFTTQLIIIFHSTCYWNCLFAVYDCPWFEKTSWLHANWGNM